MEDKLYDQNANYIKNNLGFKFFLIGIFFIPSAFPIGALFLLIALIFSFFNNNKSLLSDKGNYPLFVSIGIILFSTLNITFINKPNILNEYETQVIWINLFNWIPIFFLFWGFQTYLKNDNQRRICSKVLMSGTVPVLISFILQKYFNLFGPYQTLFGLIIWFQKPIQFIDSPIAGLFSNPNYAGIWLSLVLPFCLYELKNFKSWNSKKIFILILCFSIIHMIFLTGSRNAFLGVIISIIFLFGYKKLLYISGFLISCLFFEKLISIFRFKNNFYLNNIIPDNLIEKLSNISLFSPRIDIWHSAITRIQERPLLGWGASTFSFLHLENNQVFTIPKKIIPAQHSHNLPLELAHNFGIPLSIVIIITLSIFMVKTWNYIYKNKFLKNDYLFQKAWFSSSLILVVSHFSDITFYDGKISILASTLFAGLKCIIDEKNHSIS